MNEQTRKLYQSLCQTIADEVALYEEIVLEIKNKQRAIIDGKIEEMKESVFMERELSQSVMNQVKKRVDLTLSIKTAVGIHHEDVTLKQLLSHADPDYAFLLEELRYRLKSNVHQISKINRENKYLLSASIEHVHGLINLFLKDDSKTDIRYEGTGLISSPADENRVLDFQI